MGWATDAVAEGARGNFLNVVCGISLPILDHSSIEYCDPIDRLHLAQIGFRFLIFVAPP